MMQHTASYFLISPNCCICPYNCLSHVLTIYAIYVSLAIKQRHRLNISTWHGFTCTKKGHSVKLQPFISLFTSYILRFFKPRFFSFFSPFFRQQKTVSNNETVTELCVLIDRLSALLPAIPPFLQGLLKK